MGRSFAERTYGKRRSLSQQRLRVRALLDRAPHVCSRSHAPSGMEVDLVLAGSGLESLALGRSTRERIDGVLVPVVSASDLVVMKVLAGRGRDLEDVRGILAGDEVDLEEVRDLLTELEEALGQSDLISAFEAALRDVQKA